MEENFENHVKSWNPELRRTVVFLRNCFTSLHENERKPGYTREYHIKPSDRRASRKMEQRIDCLIKPILRFPKAANLTYTLPPKEFSIDETIPNKLGF